MAKKRIHLVFPESLVKEPVLFRMAKQFDVMPNIRKAKVSDTLGELVLEIEGTEENLTKGIQYLKDAGVAVEPLEEEFLEEQ
ncbi:MAG: NIL domain-containing protein [Nitrospirota bacterium]|nr:NIL domain-containing protein [Nitrospirota bacterium]